VWEGITDYQMTIEAHEVLGDDSADSELHYAFKRPERARLDVITGNNSGATVLLEPGNRVEAYKRGFALFRKHGDVYDKDLTSLRGNSIRNPIFGDVIDCFNAHKSDLRQSVGPVVDGEATDEVALPYANVTCPDDPAADRGVITLDVLDIARDTGLIVMRKRYIGTEVVERWEISDYKVNEGLTEDQLT